MRSVPDKSSALAVYGSGPYRYAARLLHSIIPSVCNFSFRAHRADSRICRAAIHAGVIGSNGGCALFRYAGWSACRRLL